ncbi:uncharacterized protein [Macrobrachium rosenbergii]|uniref:uncharacterized protein n=1 Tax=Macrobrachium rosenbergii TaxID=79674 RepID=UPI0034D67D5B
MRLVAVMIRFLLSSLRRPVLAHSLRAVTLWTLLSLPRSIILFLPHGRHMQWRLLKWFFQNSLKVSSLSETILEHLWNNTLGQSFLKQEMTCWYMGWVRGLVLGVKNLTIFNLNSPTATQLPSLEDSRSIVHHKKGLQRQLFVIKVFLDGRASHFIHPLNKVSGYLSITPRPPKCPANSVWSPTSASKHLSPLECPVPPERPTPVPDHPAPTLQYPSPSSERQASAPRCIASLLSHSHVVQDEPSLVPIKQWLAEGMSFLKKAPPASKTSLEATLSPVSSAKEEGDQEPAPPSSYAALLHCVFVGEFSYHFCPSCPSLASLNLFGEVSSG